MYNLVPEASHAKAVHLLYLLREGEKESEKKLCVYTESYNDPYVLCCIYNMCRRPRHSPL